MITREIEKTGLAVAFITAMSMMAKQLGVNRTVTGIKIPHPLGDPTLSAKADLTVRKEIVRTALNALQTTVNGPTIFVPDIPLATG